MKCKIDECERDVRYKADGVCQMHYFRMMRNGSYEKKKDRKKRVTARKHRTQNKKGYQMLYMQEHPLSMKNGYVYEHRFVIYSIFGDKLPPCELCEKSVSWSGYDAHIDHIDEDVTNNERCNLRVLCNACNTRRTKRTPHTEKGKISVTLYGETKTPEEWSRDDRIEVKGYVIRNRLKAGWSVEDALLKENQKGTKPCR